MSPDWARFFTTANRTRRALKAGEPVPRPAPRCRCGRLLRDCRGRCTPRSKK